MGRKFVNGMHRLGWLASVLESSCVADDAELYRIRTTASSCVMCYTRISTKRPARCQRDHRLAIKLSRLIVSTCTHGIKPACSCSLFYFVICVIIFSTLIISALLLGVFFQRNCLTHASVMIAEVRYCIIPSPSMRVRSLCVCPFTSIFHPIQDYAYNAFAMKVRSMRNARAQQMNYICYFILSWSVSSRRFHLRRCASTKHALRCHLDDNTITYIIHVRQYIAYECYLYAQLVHSMR